MKTHYVIHHPSGKHSFASSEFEEALYASMLRYSLRHLTLSGNMSQEHITEALQKALQVCYLAGINSKYHYKQIYVFDTTTGVLYIDWLMSKKGFNLMMMQFSSFNENMARWLWQLADT